MSFIKSHPVISGVLGVNVLAIVIVSIVALINFMQSAQLEVLVAPSSSKITVDGRKIENGTFGFLPGKHEIKIEKEGFESKTEIVELASGETVRFWTYLFEEDGGLEYYGTNADDMAILEEVGRQDEEVQEFLLRYEKKAEIKSVLPLTYAVNGNTNGGKSVSVSIRSGGNKCRKGFCLLIQDVFGGNLNKAIEMIKNAGYNPKDYEILYQANNGEIEEVKL